MSDAAGPGPETAARLEVVSRLADAELDVVLALVGAATEADAVRPLSEHVLLHLRHGGEGPDRQLLLHAGDRLVGYGHLDPTDVVAGSSAEVVIDPRHRRHGYGRQLVTAAAAASPDGRLRLWAHGDNAGARALAASLSYQEIRQLWQLRRSLAEPLPAVRLPAGTSIRAFRPGPDDATWLALNAKAFADHPEQGSWTEDDLRDRMEEPWFDPDGFLVAEQDGRMVGYHWTKVHGEDPQAAGPGVVGAGAVTAGAEPGHGPEPIGEVYVVGVDPNLRGQGLGRALTLAGLHRLQEGGLPRAMLYVESDNAAALAVYRGLGFTHWATDVMYRRPAG